MDNLAAGTVVSYSYDAGSKPGHTRTAVFRNYIYSKGGRAMYCDDGSLNGQCKLFLLRYVRNMLIEDDSIKSFVNCLSASVSHSLATDYASSWPVAALLSCSMPSFRRFASTNDMVAVIWSRSSSLKCRSLSRRSHPLQRMMAYAVFPLMLVRKK